MKDLIQAALKDAFSLLERQVPQTKKKFESISIQDVKPLELTTFMQSNKIPNDAYFSGRDNGYDAWDDIVLAWEIDIPTTDKDKKAFKRKQFTDVAWRFVYNLLTKSGYERVPYSTSLLKQFDDTTVYDMYISKDFDRLLKYYSLPFAKIKFIITDIKNDVVEDENGQLIDAGTKTRMYLRFQHPETPLVNYCWTDTVGEATEFNTTESATEFLVQYHQECGKDTACCMILKNAKRYLIIMLGVLNLTEWLSI